MNNGQARWEKVKVYFKVLSRNSAGETHLLGTEKQMDPYEWKMGGGLIPKNGGLFHEAV